MSWRAIFLVNLPVAVVAAGLLVRHVTETGRHRHPLDGVGQTLAVVSLALLTGGFIVAGERGWSDRLTLVLLAAGIAAGAVGAVLVGLAATDGHVWPLALAAVPLGLTAMAMPAMTATAMAGAPRDRVGLASGVLNAARQTGGALGVAVLGALLGVGTGVPSVRRSSSSPPRT